jgi:hypothetical protein
MGDNFSSHGIGISRTYWPAEPHAAAAPSASTLLKTMNDSLMQSIIHVPVELEPWHGGQFLRPRHRHLPHLLAC